MRNSIKNYCLIFLAILFTSTAFAQRDQKDFNPEKRATKMTERLTEALNLNEAQVKKIKTLHLKYAERMHSIRSEKEADDRSQKRAAMQQMRTDIEAEMKTILSEEQFQTFQSLPKRGHHGKGHHRHGKNMHGKKGSEHHKKMKTSRNEKIKPLMLEQRAKLEANISAEDKIIIAELRAERKKRRAEHKAKKEARKKAFEKGAAPDFEKRRKHRMEREHNPSHKKLMALTEKYKASIESLFTEIEPQLKAIKEEAKAACKEDCPTEKKRTGKKGFKEKHQTKKHARFLLLDPNKSLEEKADKRPRKSKSLISRVNVYPNPSQGISQIEYTLKEASMVTIELHDKEGNLIETIEKVEQTAGLHKTTVNFNNYTLGIYYIILKDASGEVISKKVIR